MTPRALLLLALLVSSAAVAPMSVLATPSEPSATAQEFLDYLLKPGANITTDTAMRQKWLGTGLRTHFDAAVRAVVDARKRPGVDGPEPAEPGNGTFLDSWDLPTVCLAERSVTDQDDATVKAVCNWGPKTNYPGVSRDVEVTMGKEGGTWRIQNIILHKNAYADDGNVLELLENIRKDAETAGR